MTKPWNLRTGSIQIGAPITATPVDDTPFRILVMGDFSGRSSRNAHAASLAERRPILIDRDNFDEVLANLKVEIKVPLSVDGQGQTVLRVGEIDDFHPDQIYDKLDVFESLRDLRDRLGNPKTLAGAADEIQHWAGPSAKAAATPPPPSDPAALLAQMLGDAGLTVTESRPQADDFTTFLRSVVGPHVVKADDPRQAELEAVVDSAIGGTMRALLHHPAFQEIEAAWRGLFLLIRRLETDENLQIYLLDLSRAEMVADLTASDDLRASRLYQLLVKQTVGTQGGKPWAVLAGNYTFTPHLADAQLLQRLALLAQHAGASFVAAAHPIFFGCPSLGQAVDPATWTARLEGETAAVWQGLRQFPETRYLALTAPRFLLRLPYGAKSSPTDRFDFEELPASPHHEDLLWGNAALLVALHLGQCFSASGWRMKPAQLAAVDNLPAVVIEEDGDKKLKPCGEAIISDRGLEKMLEAGVTPVLSVLDRDLVRLGPIQSFATPATALPGRWLP